LYSLALGFLSLYLSFNKTISIPRGEAMENQDSVNVDSIVDNLVRNTKTNLFKYIQRIKVISRF
jgi:hypothetical protein